MTRKRFIKLLMSHGETLHSAKTIAYLYRSRDMSYKNAYSDYLSKTSIKRSFERLSKAAVKCGKALTSVVTAFNKLAFSMKEMPLNYD